MSARALLLALAAALLAVIAATVAVVGQLTGGDNLALGRPALPAVAKDPAVVARIDLAHPKARYRFIRRDGQWITPDKFDHPLSARRVNGLINELAALRLVEAKTRRPARFGRIGLDPAGGSHLRLFNDAGAVLGDVTIGDRLARPTGTAKAGTFLRREGEDQAWLASGGVTLPVALKAWLATIVIDLDRARVAVFEMAPRAANGAAAPAWTVGRGDPGEAFSRLSAAGIGPAAPEAAAALARRLHPLRFSDVRRRRPGALVGHFARLRVASFDGLVVTLDLGREQTQNWARLAVSARADAAAEVTAEAARLNDKVKPWAYALAPWLVDRLTDRHQRLAP
ncbi:MAG: hypothetical protein VYA68_12545 [Pseudomonadota bacterium]|nr:hypothetical protein [Pseudomonadota bacterium]